MDGSSDINARGNASEDLDDLLSTPVLKDYINCVWTTMNSDKMDSDKMDAGKMDAGKMDAGKMDAGKMDADKMDADKMDSDSSPKKLVIAEVAADADHGTASDNTDKTVPASASKDALKQVESSTLKRKRRRRKIAAKVKEDHVAHTEKSPVKAEDKLLGGAKDASVPDVCSPDIGKSVNTINQEVTTGMSKATKNLTMFSWKEKIDPHLFRVSCDKAKEESLFTAYKNLIVQRSLPPYTPKLLDTRFFSGNFFNCRACGDKYVLQTSFLGHMSRKTTRFSYKCPACKVQLSFDNRCSFLIHIASHGLDPNNIQSEDLRILPLSPKENECNSLFTNTSANYIKCLECSKLVSSLLLHLQGNDALDPKYPVSKSTPATTSSCKECSLILPTKCSLSAHERYHRGDPPHLCPECGELFLKASTLLKHMEDHCLHNLKKTVFQCGYCQVVMPSFAQFLEHLETKHMRQTFKCHVCGMSVSSLEDFNAHRIGKHDLQSVEANSGIAALSAQVECDQCPGVSIHADCLLDHASCHTVDPKISRTVFQCVACQCMYANKRLMLSHRSTCQGKAEVLGDTPIGNNCAGLFADLTSPFQSAVPSGESEVRTNQRSLTASGRASVAGNLVSLEEISDDEEQLNITLTNDTTPQQVCVEGKTRNSQNSAESVEVTVLGAQKIGQSHSFKKNIVCKLCRKVVSVGADKAVIKKHFLSQHFHIFMKAIHSESNGQLPMQIVYTESKDTVSRSDTEVVNKLLRSTSVKGDFSKLKPGMVRKKRAKSKLSKPSISLLKVGAEAKKLRKVKMVGFKCYKCSFASQDMETFRTHILLHKSNPSDLQCPECGLCFIVRPPLQKHLIAEHGIKSVDKYLIDNGFEEYFSEEEEEGGDEIVNVEESDAEELQENQCKVCKEHFESALMLEKHFRVHGGAFLLANLKAKRLSQ